MDIGLWRLDAGMQRLSPSGMPSEKRLEDLIESDPSVLGAPLLIIGRQVPTSSGKFVDLLALDAEGAVHVLELKRDRTPRDVVAQTLDYGSWVQELSHEDVLEIYARYNDSKALEVAFEECLWRRPSGGTQLRALPHDRGRRPRPGVGAHRELPRRHLRRPDQRRLLQILL